MGNVTKHKTEKWIVSRDKDSSSANTLLDRALIDFASTRKEKNLKDLRGKISFREDYDHKSMRK